jgi:hypothetical protein
MVRRSPLRHKDDGFSGGDGSGSNGLHGRARLPMCFPNRDQCGLCCGNGRRSGPTSTANTELPAGSAAEGLSADTLSTKQKAVAQVPCCRSCCGDAGGWSSPAGTCTRAWPSPASSRAGGSGQRSLPCRKPGRPGVPTPGIAGCGRQVTPRTAVRQSWSANAHHAKRNCPVCMFDVTQSRCRVTVTARRKPTCP